MVRIAWRVTVEDQPSTGAGPLEPSCLHRTSTGFINTWLLCLKVTGSFREAEQVQFEQPPAFERTGAGHD